MERNKNASTDRNQVNAYGKKINKSLHRSLDLSRNTMSSVRSKSKKSVCNRVGK